MLYLPSMAISIGYGADEDMRVHLADAGAGTDELYPQAPHARLTFCNLNGPALPGIR